MQDGRTLRFKLYGRHTSAGQTVIFRTRWGGVAGTILAASPTLTAQTATAGIWKYDGIIQTRSNGATGTVYCITETMICDDTAATAIEGLGGSAGVATPAAVTVDLTADTALSMTVTFGTAGSNAVTGHIYILEALN
jgi:hypothetical protein